MSETETRSEAQSEKSDTGTVIFDDSLDITLVAGYFEKFSQLLNEQKTIILNGADIERVDGAGLQLLAAFFKSAEFLQITIQWQGVSDTLRHGAEISGLAGVLALD